MADPIAQSTLPDGHPLAPGALDTVPSDWADMEALGTPYIPVLVAHPDTANYPNVPIIRWRLSTGAGGAIATGYGNNYGNDYGGPA